MQKQLIKDVQKEQKKNIEKLKSNLNEKTTNIEKQLKENVNTIIQ